MTKRSQHIITALLAAPQPFGELGKVDIIEHDDWTFRLNFERTDLMGVIVLDGRKARLSLTRSHTTVLSFS